MSSKGIYTALSGAMAQTKRMDTIANNIANVNTTGFKKDKQTFYEYLTANEKPPDVIQVPKVPASIESFYDTQGGDRGYVDSAGTYTDFTQGLVKKTGNAFDLAIEGQGLFEVLTPEGVKFTRNGSFIKNAEGLLVTKQGFPVLSEGSGQPNQRTISVDQASTVTISFAGDVYLDNEPVSKISVLVPENPDGLKKVGSSLFVEKQELPAGLNVASNYKLHQGYLEASNVNVIQEMTDMISATRNFESTQKAIQAFDMINGKLVNDVPKTGF